MNQVQFLHSILEHEQFVSNMNNEINTMEKELMIQEHHVLIQEAKQEGLNEEVKALPAPGKESFKTNLSNKAKAIIAKVKEMLVKFKTWVTNTYKKMVVSAKSKLASITKAVEGKVGIVKAPYDFKASMSNFIKIPAEVAATVGQLGNMGGAKDRASVTNVSTKVEAHISKVRKLGEMFTVNKETKYLPVNLQILKVVGEGYVKGLNMLGQDMDKFINQTTSAINALSSLDNADLQYYKASQTAKLVSGISSASATIAGKAITQVNALASVCAKLGGKGSTEKADK